MKHDKRDHALFKEDFHCLEMICLCSKTYFCDDSLADKNNFGTKGLIKRPLEDCGFRPKSKHRKLLEEIVNVTSTRGGCLTYNMLLPHMSKQRRDCPISNPKKCPARWKTQSVPLKRVVVSLNYCFTAFESRLMFALQIVYTVINFLDFLNNLFIWHSVTTVPATVLINRWRRKNIRPGQ